LVWCNNKLSWWLFSAERKLFDFFFLCRWLLPDAESSLIRQALSAEGSKFTTPQGLTLPTESLPDLICYIISNTFVLIATDLMGKKKRSGPLSHEEIWDDSALVRSWDDAVEEYEVYIHTILYFRSH
jgi:hypothetical protein